jgi:hypothetical protein
VRDERTLFEVTRGLWLNLRAFSAFSKGLYCRYTPTAVLHRPNPVAREMPGFIGFFARRDQVAEREGLSGGFIRSPYIPRKAAIHGRLRDTSRTTFAALNPWASNGNDRRRVQYPDRSSVPHG